MWPDSMHRPPYELTEAQGDRFDRLYDFLLHILEARPSVSEEEQQQVNRQLLDLIVQLFDHAIPDTAYNSVLISTLAALGWEEEGGGQARWATHRYIRPLLRSAVFLSCSSRGSNASNRAGAAASGRRRAAPGRARAGPEGYFTRYERRPNGL